MFHWFPPPKIAAEKFTGGKTLRDVLGRKLAQRLPVPGDVNVVHLLRWLYEECLSGQSCADQVAKAHDHLQSAEMAQESLQSIPLGTPAAEFSLPDVVTGKTVSLSSLPRSRGLLVMFICRHCPYVIHVRDEILRIASDYKSKGISFVAISSNDAAAYPDDAPDKLREMALENSFPVPPPLR